MNKSSDPTVAAVASPASDKPSVIRQGVQDRQRRVDFVVAFAGMFMQMGSGLIMLPATAAALPSEAFALWYVFMTLQILVHLINDGTLQAFMRHLTFVLSGASNLTKSGIPLRDSEEVNVGSLAQVIAASRYLHLLLAVGATIIVSVVGGFYIAELARATPDLPYVWESWYLFAFALLMHIYFNWQIPIQFGADRARHYYATIIVSRLIQVVTTIVGLIYFPNLLTVVVGFFMAALAMRIQIYFSVRDIIKECDGIAVDKAKRRKVIETIMPHALRQTLVAIGAFAIGRTTLLVAALFSGVGQSASQYAAASQALFALDSVSRVATMMLQARITNARVARDEETLRSLAAVCYVYGFVVFCCGGAALLMVGNILLEMIDSQTMLPPVAILLLMCAVFVTDLIMNISALLIATSNQIPFMRSYLVSGTLVVLGMIAAGVLGYGLATFILVQGVVLWAYNAWRWPTYVAKDVGLTFQNFIPSATNGLRKLAFGRI